MIDQTGFAGIHSQLRRGSDDEQDLWHRIESHCFEDQAQGLTFTRRLARDHAWTVEFARQAIDEYRRFAFLAVVSSGQMTPSEEVDEVWHQHLTYSRDYWEQWCAKVLRTPLHHGPTGGGPAEGMRFALQYAETLALYETYFGAIDQRFWPATARRFGKHPRFRTVDRDAVLVIPRPRELLRRWMRAVRPAGTALNGKPTR